MSEFEVLNFKHLLKEGGWKKRDRKMTTKAYRESAGNL